MDEASQVSCIIDKLPPSWKDFKHTLIYLKEELTLVELGSYLHIKESLRVQDNDKPKGNNVAGPLDVNMVEHNNSSSDLCDLHATPLLGNKRYFVTFIDDASRFCYVYLLYTKDEALDKFKGSCKIPDPKLKTMRKRSIECIFVGYAEHSKAFRFYVIEPNESVAINSIIESMDAIFDENRLFSVPRPSIRIPDRTKDIGGSVVPKKVTEKSDYSLDGCKDSFFNGELEEEVYMNQPQGFIMPDNENKASKKQTCITGSTIEYEFVALAASGKEAKWLKNLLLEIPLWSKPIAPISIRCDSAAILANAYSQMYNGKSRHLGVRHSMIHELITNGWYL
nr:zinc finger, CCHC-type [Tanacetum cinerariifolium]